jgi:hypothetical protein
LTNARFTKVIQDVHRRVLVWQPAVQLDCLVGCGTSFQHGCTSHAHNQFLVML